MPVNIFCRNSCSQTKGARQPTREQFKVATGVSECVAGSDVGFLGVCTPRDANAVGFRCSSSGQLHVDSTRRLLIEGQHYCHRITTTHSHQPATGRIPRFTSPLFRADLPSSDVPDSDDATKEGLSFEVSDSSSLYGVPCQITPGVELGEGQRFNMPRPESHQLTITPTNVTAGQVIEISEVWHRRFRTVHAVHAIRYVDTSTVGHAQPSW